MGEPVKHSQAKLRFSTRKIVLLVGIISVLILSVGLYAMRKRQTKIIQTPTFAQELQKYPDSPSAKSEITNKYSGTYDQSVKQVNGTNPTTWDKASIDNAYKALLYTDKIGAFGQTKDMLARLQNAQKSGVNIDDNSFGIDQRQRDEILKRADEQAKQFSSKSTGSKN